VPMTDEEARALLLDIFLDMAESKTRLANQMREKRPDSLQAFLLEKQAQEIYGAAMKLPEAE